MGEAVPLCGVMFDFHDVERTMESGRIPWTGVETQSEFRFTEVGKLRGGLLSNTELLT